MNQDQILNLLIDAFQNFDGYMHAKLQQEIINLISRTGYEAKFLKLLIVRLAVLRETGIMACKQQEFENIGDGIYSMHLSGNGFNIRILYGFLKDHTPALLLAFEEREGKSKTDYTSYIPTAKARLEEATI